MNELNNNLIEEKEEKKKNIFKEIISFIILVLLFAGIIGGGYYWYTNVYNPKKDVSGKVERKAGYNVVTYSAGKYENEDGEELNNELKVLNDKYLLEYSGEKLVKVMDSKTKVIYENKDDTDNISYEVGEYENELYFYSVEYGDTENIVTLYKAEKKELKEVIVLKKTNVEYLPIIYNEDDYSYLVGFGGVYSESTDETGDNYKYTSYIYNMNGKSYTLNDGKILGDKVGSVLNMPYYLQNKNVIKFSDSNDKYGVYDIKAGKIVIDASYSDIKSLSSGNFVVERNGKYGLIDVSLRKLLDYDFDAIYYDGMYYSVEKGNKRALVDVDYKFITDYVFPKKQYMNIDGGSPVSFENSTIINDVYFINDLKNVYAIKKDGSHKKLSADNVYVDKKTKLIYSYNEKYDGKYTVYDLELNKKYEIDFSDYDYSIYPGLELKGDILVLGENKLFFDYKTGERVDNFKEYRYDIGELSLYDDGTKTGITLTDKLLHTIDSDKITFDHEIVEIENGLYFTDGLEYVLVEKDA